MRSLISGRDFVRIGDAAEILGVSEHTLRNWDRSGKLRAHRHPINGYRMYRVADLHGLLREIGGRSLDEERDRAGEQLALGFVAEPSDSRVLTEDLPPCHWGPEVALDPKHRPQRWDAPSSTVRRDWRKYPQEAYVLDESCRRYRRLTPEEIAILQGFEPNVVDVSGLTDRQLIASVGDAVPPPLARELVAAIDERVRWENKTAIEICAGIGGLATGAAAAGLEHLLLLDHSEVCGELLKHDRPWSDEAVNVAALGEFDFSSFKGAVGLLSGGPPCQPWSQSGLRRGQSDDRDLLGSLPELVSEVDPEAFLFENVPGLASAENLLYLEHLVEQLRCSGRGYGVLVSVFNAADFGVPQLRRRLFILGLRGRPASDAHRVFDAVDRRRTHRNPADSTTDLPKWRTVGHALSARPDPGGWRRWITSGLG